MKNKKAITVTETKKLLGSRKDLNNSNGERPPIFIKNASVAPRAPKKK